MKVKKYNIAIAALISVSLASVGVFFGFDLSKTKTSRPNAISPIKQNTTIKKIQPIKSSNNEKTNSEFSLNKYYQPNNQNTVSTEFNSEYYKKKLEMLRDLGKSVGEKDVLLMPSHYYQLFAQEDDIFKTLTYKGQRHESSYYELANTLALTINKNADNRNVLAAFIDYTKEAMGGRNVINYKLENFLSFQNSKKITSDRCFNLNQLHSDKSRWKQMISGIYTTLNCEAEYGFGEFDLDAFLSGLLEIRGKEVIVSDTETGVNEDGLEYVSLETAKKLSNEKNIQNGDKVTIYQDFQEYFSSLTFDKLAPLMNVASTLENKLAPYIVDEPDPLKILEGIVKNNDKFDIKSSNTLIAILLGVLGNINSLHHEAIEKEGFTSIIKNGDVSKVMLESVGEGLQDLLLQIIYSDEDFISYMFNSVVDHDNPDSKKASELVLDEYQAAIDAKSTRITEVRTKLAELSKTLKAKQKEITSLQGMETNWLSSDDYQSYLETKESIEFQQAQIDFWESKLLTENTLLETYKASLKQYKIMKENEVNVNQQIATIEARIELATERIQDFKTKLTTKRATLKELKAKKDKFEASNDLSEIITDIGRLAKVLDERKKVNHDYKVLQEEEISLAGKISDLNRKIKALNLWHDRTDVKSGIEHLLDAGLVNTVLLFLDVVSTVAYDALSTLNLGKYDNEKGFIFEAPDLCGITCIGVALPFFKEKRSVEVLNKLLLFMNNTVAKFTDNTIRSASKLIFNIFPQAMFDLLNTSVNILGIDIDFRKGVHIGPEDLYPVITGITAGVSFAGPALLGVGRGIVKGIRENSKKKGFITAGIGALIGVVSAVIGAGVSAGVTRAMFGDATLDVVAPDERAVDILLELKEKEKSGEKIEFNLFTDGHILLKENFIPKINAVFKDLAKLFVFSESKLFEDINNFILEHPDKKFSAWEMIGEILKTMITSPNFLQTILTKKNYASTGYGLSILESDIVANLRENVRYDKELLASLAKDEPEEFIDDLYNLETKILDWLFDATLITKKTKFIHAQTNKRIQIGYNPADLRVEVLNLWEKKFQKLTQVSNDFEWVPYTDVSETANLDGYFSYQKLDSELIAVSVKSVSDLKIMAQGHKKVTIPLYKLPFVAVTSIWNRSLSDIDQEFIEANLIAS